MREVIKTADRVIDLGPQAGDKGGEIVAEGTPEQVTEEPRSNTGGYLKKLLAKSACAEFSPRAVSEKTERRFNARARLLNDRWCFSQRRPAGSLLAAEDHPWRRNFA
jgi:hypothetical protein